MTVNESSPPAANRFLPRRAGLIFAALAFLALVALAVRTIRSDTALLLVPHPHCNWIVYPSPAIGWASRPIALGTEFRRSVVSKGPTAAEMKVWALQSAVVRLNGILVKPSAIGKNWKQASLYDLGPLLRSGTNELSITVYSKLSLPALAASVQIDGVQLGTDETWESSFTGGTWLPAQLASKPFPIRRGNDLYVTDTPASGFETNAGLLIAFAVFGAVLFLMVKLAERFPAPPANRIYGPDRLPWLFLAVLVVAWGALWCNNLGYLPFSAGFDADDHREYIDYILKRHALPYADQGFQMYQPPLYYLCAADLLKAVGAGPFDANGMFVLRLFGLLCGVAALTFLLLSARLLFPGKPGRQILALALGALMSMNLYIYQYVTNEILNTMVMFASFYVCLRILVNESLSLRQHLVAGLLLGLAMLAKSSAIVLLVIGFTAITANLWIKGGVTRERAALYVLMPAALALMVCGWHYFRVAIRFGNPFTTNLDPVSGFGIWQAPGFRTINSFAFSGTAIASPFFSGFASVPDVFYATLWGDGLWGGAIEDRLRPPWNYSLMAAGYWLALVPTVLMIIGALQATRRFLRKPEPVNMQCLGLIFLTALLLIHMSLKAPAYSAPKAFYASGSLVVLCFLGVEGYAWVIRRFPGSRAFLVIALTVWGLAAYCAFWIRPASIANQLTRKVIENRRDDTDPKWLFAEASSAAIEKRYDEAIHSARRATTLAPDYWSATYELAACLSQAGRKTEALTAAREAVRLMPLKWKSHALLAEIAGDLGRTEEAAAQNAIVARLQ